MIAGHHTDYLPAGHVQRILLMLCAVSAPHWLHLPAWAVLLTLAIGVWRWLAARNTWAMPKQIIKLLLAFLGFSGIYAHYGTLNGHSAGVALLVVMMSFKLLEMTTRRDYLVVVFLSYFLLVTHFLFVQDIWMLAVLFLGTVAITTVLIDVNHPQGMLPLQHSAKLASKLSLQAVPVMLIFFVLFPRIPGPLWGLPSKSGAGTTGLSNSMEPGLISSLSQSDAVAFRVRFDDYVPANEELYWRGPVFNYFNGRSWTPGLATSHRPSGQIEYLNPAFGYEIQLEPHGGKWLLALDMPYGPFPKQSKFGIDHVLRFKYAINDKRLYNLKAVTHYRADAQLSAELRRWSLSLPANRNPRTVELAKSWRTKYESDEEIIKAALNYFRQQTFSYTLQPTMLLSNNPVDEFLFDTLLGFCEHYSSAFTVLMRAAGVPARVVTGYQGIEKNGDYYIVRQSNAHAWSEVWLADKGWVRIDPTAAVAPERIQLGMAAALSDGEPIPGLARLNRDYLADLQLQLDKINAAWNRWILAYGPELQQQFLSRLGLPSLREILLALTVGTMLVLGAVAAWLTWTYRSQEERDPVLKIWRRYQRKLRKLKFDNADSEGPLDLSQRIESQKPEWAESAQRISQLYIRLRYSGSRSDPQLLQRFKQRVQKFPTTP